MQTINLGDTFWISEIPFQYPGSSPEDNKAIVYIFGISMCFSQHVMSFEIFLTQDFETLYSRAVFLNLGDTPLNRGDTISEIRFGLLRDR